MEGMLRSLTADNEGRCRNVFVIVRGGALLRLSGPVLGPSDSIEHGRVMCWEGKWRLWLFVRR